MEKTIKNKLSIKKPATNIMLCAWGYSDARQVEPEGFVRSGGSSSTLLAIMGRPVPGIVKEGNNATVGISGKASAVQLSGDFTIIKNKELNLKKDFISTTGKKDSNVFKANTFLM